MIPLEERMELVSALTLVDEVCVYYLLDKVEMWDRLHFDVIFKGDDSRGTAKGERLEQGMAEVGARVSYFPYTQHISSTKLRALVEEANLLGDDPLDEENQRLASRRVTDADSDLIRTCGVPAAYGGFETAVEEIGARLAARGNDVTVDTRPDDRATAPREFKGMQSWPLPAVHSKALEELATHTGLSVGHVVGRDRPDAAFLFNAANALYLPALRARRIPVATHVDGLEWKRTKWGGGGRRFYRISELLAVRYSDALIADAAGIADYYRSEFGATTDLIAYGAPILTHTDPHCCWPTGSCWRPPCGGAVRTRNHVLEIVRGYVASNAELPLVVVGGAPFAAEYTQQIHAAALGDERVRSLVLVYYLDVLDSLYFHTLTYVHGHWWGGRIRRCCAQWVPGRRPQPSTSGSTAKSWGAD